MSRSPSRDRSASRAFRTFAASGDQGLTLLKAYATTPATDEATPRVITLSTPSTAGRTMFAVACSSASLTLPSPWTSLASASGGTVWQSWKLVAADNTGFSTVSVTQGTAYPFSMVIIEDDVDTIAFSTAAVGSAGFQPSGGTWNNYSATFTSTWRNVAFWAAQTYQSPPDANITAYSHGMTQVADTGVSSIYSSGHVGWYSNRIWAASVDGLSGVQQLSASATSTNLSAAWVNFIAYTVLP